MRAFARIGDLPSAAFLRQRMPCWRKVPHRSMAAAEAHLRALRRNPMVRHVETLGAYRSWHCHSFHVGHERSEVK